MELIGHEDDNTHHHHSAHSLCYRLPKVPVVSGPLGLLWLPDFVPYILPFLHQLEVLSFVHIVCIVVFSGLLLGFLWLAFAFAGDAHFGKFLSKEFHKFWVFEVVLETTVSHPQPFLPAVLSTSVAGLVAVHEADGGKDEGANIPG